MRDSTTTARKKIFSSAIVLAAGRGARCGAGKPKQFKRLGGKRLFEYSVDAFRMCPDVDEVIVALPGGKVPGKGLPAGTKIVTGGRRRQDSVAAALKEVSSAAEVVAVGDSARPFVTGQLISGCIRAAVRYGAAIAGVPVSDTVKKAQRGFVSSTVDRGNLFRAQTPQAFSAVYLKKMLGLLNGRKMYTDEAAALEELGAKIKIVDPGSGNMKITTADDLKTAALIMQSRKKDEKYLRRKLRRE